MFDKLCVYLLFVCKNEYIYCLLEFVIYGFDPYVLLYICLYVFLYV